MSSRQVRFLILIATSLLSVSAQPSNLTCEVQSFSNFNATGSTSFPGFHPNGSVPGFQDSTWTLHTGFVDFFIALDNRSLFQQSYWLSTDPVITTPAAKFPFAGCTFLLDLSDNQNTRAPTTGSNTCEHIFDNACQSAIIDMVNSNITASGNTTDEELCSSIMENIVSPPQCKNSMWSLLQVQQPFGNPNFIPDDCGVSSANIFNSTGKTNSLIDEGSYTVPGGNYTFYDESTKMVQPLIMTMWPKNSTTAWEPDTRLFCIAASDIAAGSLVPSSAMSAQPIWSSLHALGAVMIVVLALL